MTDTATTSRLEALHDAGQAVWLDFVDRGFLREGGLKRLIDEDGLTGVTSNPSIFEKAMGHGDAYDEGMKVSLAESDDGVMALYEGEAIADIRAAAADLRPVYDRMDGKDGYVSLEVSPHLAGDAGPTIAEARRLWAAVDAPNVMIKVPGTESGAAAIRQLIEDGLNVNVTLLFSIEAYKAVAEAHAAGLEARAALGKPVDRVASVASFFVSRIDAVIDERIDERGGEAEALRGKVAIANAKLAYAWHRDFVASDRWLALAARGAMPQRLLWASTGVKDAAYRDTLYVDELIGPDTVNTMPVATMDAFRERGTVRETLTEDVDAARHVLAEAERLGLDLDGVTAKLVEDGVKLFADAFDKLLGGVADKRAAMLGPRLDSSAYDLPEPLGKAVKERLATATSGHWPRRLWAGDAGLWTGKDEAKWLGWLPAAAGAQVDISALAAFRKEAKAYKDIVLLGMGGSSLGPEVLALILGAQDGGPTLHVLDTTDPGQIRTVAGGIDPAETLFVVSSKSGSTMEPELLRAYFWDLAGRDGSRFVAITDPGSKLENAARADGFAHVFHGDPTIGGRYSVLSVFGMVPGAAMGLDVAALFDAIRPMLLSCGADVPPAANPGVHLGVIMGEAALAGHDKLTILPSPGLAPLGAWLEQLIAESTGKEGKGIVPVDLEPHGRLDDYEEDRLFVHLHLEGDSDGWLQSRAKALARAGHPVVRIAVASRELIGQEFVRWEIATAIAGAVIGIDPFDQPDVEDAKVATRKLVDAYEETGALEDEDPAAETDDFVLYGRSDLDGFFAGASYAGFLAYIERDAANEAAIAKLRAHGRDSEKIATVAGFGPRFLHSTGQAYKGGPGGAAFLTITREPDPDLAIPGRKASFATVQLAQAKGDMTVLAARGRKVARVHLKKGGGGLAALAAALGAK